MTVTPVPTSRDYPLVRAFNPAPLPEAQIRSLSCRNAHIEVLDQATGTRPVHRESQVHIPVYEVTAAPAG
jgi:hypothetical protein